MDHSNSTSKSFSLTWVLLLVGAAISISLIFLGIQMKNQSDNAMSDAQLTQKIEQILAKQEQLLPQKIEQGIKAFIDKQQQNQMEQMHLRNSQNARTVRQNAAKVRKPDSAKDHIYGNSTAGIALIEYAGIGCPACKDFHPVAKEIVDQYAGKVNWVYRHFPIASRATQDGTQGAVATECAFAQGGNKAFWEYQDSLYQNTLKQGELPPATIMITFAELMGLNVEEFQSCLVTNPSRGRIKEDTVEATSVGFGIPGIVLMNQKTGEVRVISELSKAAFEVEINRMLAPQTSLKTQVKQGKALFAQNCASCHGKEAAGGVSPAPALNGSAHSWHHTESSLFRTIKNGSTAKNSVMQGWKGRMTDAEIWAVTRYFQSLWKPEYLQ